MTRGREDDDVSRRGEEEGTEEEEEEEDVETTGGGAALRRLIFMLTDRVAKGRADGRERTTQRGRTLRARTNSDVISAALQGRTRARVQGISVLSIYFGSGNGVDPPLRLVV